MHIRIPIEVSVISRLNSYIGSIFDVIHAASNNRYVVYKDIRLLILDRFLHLVVIS